MAKKAISVEDFIKKASELHENKYTYEKVEIIKKPWMIPITCPIHGDFIQNAYNHLIGQGCSKCAAIKTMKDNKNSFEKRARAVHGEKYDYSLVEYTYGINPVSIICPKHGIFEKSASRHIQGAGCNKCGIESTVISNRRSIEEFIEHCSKVHNNKYDYSKTHHGMSLEHVTITCPIHGDFQQKVVAHRRGQGCPFCHIDSFSRTEWIKGAKDRLGTFYILRCWNDKEEFYKFGITYNSIKKRYPGRYSMPYDYEVVKTIVSKDLAHIFDLEKRFKRRKKKQHYVPKIEFYGHKLECFKFTE